MSSPCTLFCDKTILISKIIGIKIWGGKELLQETIVPKNKPKTNKIHRNIGGSQQEMN